MIQQADILSSIRSRWNRDKTLVRLVPGGLDHLENTGTKEPWARFWLEEDEQPEFNSGAVYIQSFTLNLGVFSTRGPVDSAAIANTVSRLFNRNRPQDFLLPGPNGRFLGITAAPGALELDENEREAKSVLLLSKRYTLLIQGDV